MATQKTNRGAASATAQRLLNLAFIFNTTSRPLSTDEIVSDSDLGYGSAVRASDIRKFRRDRASLAERGICISEVHPAGAPENKESFWKLDRERTFADTGVITVDDAQALVAAIDEYLTGSTTPLLKPLMAVRSKALEAAQAHGYHPVLARKSPSSTALQAVLDAIWIAFSLRRALPFSYTNAAGDTSSRIVSIYGIFSHEGISYITGLDNTSGEVRTFRADRMERVKQPRDAYEIPEDFSIYDYLFMPFDFGSDEAVEAVFTFPEERDESELRAITRNRGALKRADNGSWSWRVLVRSIPGAAEFALAHARDGMRACAPQELVACWRDTIAKAVSICGKR